MASSRRADGVALPQCCVYPPRRDGWSAWGLRGDRADRRCARHGPRMVSVRPRAARRRSRSRLARIRRSRRTPRQSPTIFGAPRDWRRCARPAREQHAAVAVPDHAMVEGMKRSPNRGISAAPEGGAALAAIKRLVNDRLIRRDGIVVLFNTGGLWKLMCSVPRQRETPLASSTHASN